MSEHSLELLSSLNTKEFLDAVSIFESELSGNNEQHRILFVNSFCSLIKSKDSRIVETAFSRIFINIFTKLVINNYFHVLKCHISIQFLKSLTDSLSDNPIKPFIFPYLCQLFIRKGFEEKISNFVSDNPFCMLFEIEGIDLVMVHNQMKLTITSSSYSQYLEDFLLYSIKYDNGKLILHTLLPFYFSHFTASSTFVKHLLEGEHMLSTQPSIIAPILSTSLQAGSPDLVNCLLYSVLLTIQSQGDVYSTCRFVEQTLKSTSYSVDYHSVLLCCSFFTEVMLTPNQVRSCSSLLAHIVRRYIQQKDLYDTILIPALLFAAIGNQQQLMQTIMQTLMTLRDRLCLLGSYFCKEEEALVQVLFTRQNKSFSNHFISFLHLFSDDKSAFDLCLESVASIHDPYSARFTIFLLALQFHTYKKHVYQLRNLYYHLADFVDSPSWTQTVLSVVYPLITTKETTCMGLQILTDCYLKDPASFSKGYWVGIHRCLISYPSDSEVHTTILNQLCRVLEITLVDKDEIIAIAAHMTRFYLISSSEYSLLQALLQLLILLLEMMIISPASLIELIQKRIETPELTSLCFEFFIECSSIRRYRRRVIDLLWTETLNNTPSIQEEAWSALASLPSSLLLDQLPQVVGVEGDALLAVLIDRLKTSLNSPPCARSISRICCVVDGLFDNRKKGTSPVLKSPVEEEFVSISSYWNDVHTIFNEFSRAQDLLFPLASYTPAATTRDEAIQMMNQCLHAIVEYPPLLFVPSLLQNSLLVYTQLVDKAIHEFTSHFINTIHSKDLPAVLKSLSTHQSANAFLLYLHMMQHSASFINDLQHLFHTISSYPAPLQHTFLLILPSIPVPSSLLPEVIAYYTQQLKFHSNDSWTPYGIVGVARLLGHPIPENCWPSLQPLLQTILAPFTHLLQQSLQAKQSSRRRITESPLVMDALIQFAGESQWQASSEQTMTVLSTGFSLLSWFHKTGNTTLFTELLNAAFEFCKAKYPIEFKISSVLAFAELLNGSIPVNDTIMKRLEVFILNGSNYASRLNTCKECTMLCNLLLHSFLSSHPAAAELLQNQQEENKWIVDDLTTETIHLFGEYERVLHWSFADILHFQYSLLITNSNPCIQTQSQSIQHSCYPFVAAHSTPSLQHNPILTLSPTAYTRQLWSLLYHTESSHPSIPSLVHCLLDGLSFTYCPSGDLTEVMAVILSLSHADETLLSRAIHLLQERIEAPLPLFSEFLRWYQSQHVQPSAAFLLSVLKHRTLLTADPALFAEFLLHCKDVMPSIPAEESNRLLDALGGCLKVCSTEVRTNVIQTVNAILLSAKTASPAVFQTIPRAYYLSMLKNFATVKRSDCITHMLQQAHQVEDLTLKDWMAISQFAVEQSDYWKVFLEAIYQHPIPFQHPEQTLEQLVEKVEEVWGNKQAVQSCIGLLGTLISTKPSENGFDKASWVRTSIIFNSSRFDLLKDVLEYAIRSVANKQADLRHFLDTLKDILKYVSRPATKELESIITYCIVLVESITNTNIQNFDSRFYNVMTRF